MEEKISFGLSPIAISNYFIDKANENNLKIDLLKVTKLAYFAYGITLSLLNKKLFDEKIQAWDYGPVVPSIYHTFKEYGREDIKSKAKDLSFDSKSFKMSFYTPEVSKKDLNKLMIKVTGGKEMNALDITWRTFGKYSGLKLVDMTHLENTPWDKVYKPNEKNIVLNDDDIKEYFQNTLGFKYE